MRTSHVNNVAPSALPPTSPTRTQATKFHRHKQNRHTNARDMPQTKRTGSAARARGNRPAAATCEGPLRPPRRAARARCKCERHRPRSISPREHVHTGVTDSCRQAVPAARARARARARAAPTHDTHVRHLAKRERARARWRTGERRCEASTSTHIHYIGVCLYGICVHQVASGAAARPRSSPLAAVQKQAT